jgi:hypothetical protein
MHIGRHIVQELVFTFGEPEVERWDVPMSDEEIDSVERYRNLGRAHDVSLVIQDGGRLAVIRKPGYPPGAYRFPSGGIHPEESFVDGAAREALEETGLVVRIGLSAAVHVTFVCGSAGRSGRRTSCSRGRARVPSLPGTRPRSRKPAGSVGRSSRAR